MHILLHAYISTVVMCFVVLQLIGGDPDKDIAVLQLLAPAEKVAELKPIRLGQSSRLLVGQKVYAIGNPFGLDHTLTQVWLLNTAEIYGK